jgi:hypothetical protein
VKEHSQHALSRCGRAPFTRFTRHGSRECRLQGLHARARGNALAVQRGLFGILAPIAHWRGYRATHPSYHGQVLAPRTSSLYAISGLPPFPGASTITPQKHFNVSDH